MRGITRRRLLGEAGLGVAALAVGAASFGPSAEALAGPLPAGYLHTQGAQILDANNKPVRLAGVSWYGLEGNSMVPGGLNYRTLDYICQQVRNLGFNLIRLPYSVQAVQSNPRINNYLEANLSLQGQTVLQIMDAVIAAAGRYGLKVVLDNHRSEAAWSLESNGLWYTQPYPQSVWLSTWGMLVRRYRNNSTVIGCDLRNEPGSPPPDSSAWPQNGGSLWGYGDPNATGHPRDWVLAAESAGNYILSLNPNLLIFAEGVRHDPAGPSFNGKDYFYWPGGNLAGVGKAGGGRPAPRPVTLSVPNRLVYSAQDYGPDLYSGLAWCQLGTTALTPDACRGVWDRTWGYIAKQEIAPVWLGEFGTVNGFKPNDTTSQQDYADVNNVNSQGNWFSYLVQYIKDNNISWCYWPLNGTQSADLGRDPSQPDWYGVLNPTWAGTASQPVMNKLRMIQ
jgi:endoglucanase